MSRLVRRCSALILVSIVTVAVASGPPPVCPHATPSWTLELASPVQWQRVTHLGHLLVQTETALHGVDPTIGKIAWTRPGLVSLDPAHCEEIPHTPVLVCRGIGPASDVAVLDTMGGTVVFDSRKIAPAKLVDFWPLAENDGLLVLTDRGVLALYELARGEIRWQRKVAPPARGRTVPKPLELAGSLIYASGDALARFDAGSGSILWRRNDVELGQAGRLLTRGDGDPIFVYAAEHRSGRIAGASTYSAYEVANGSPVWAEPTRVPGPLEPTSFAESGLVVGLRGTSNPVRSIDLASGLLTTAAAATGAALEEEWLHADDALVAPAPDGGWFAFSTDEGALYRLDRQANATRISHGRVIVRADDAEPSIETYRDGVLVRSAQQLVSFGRSGELRFQVHFPAPRDPAVRVPLDEAARASAALESVRETLPARYRHVVTGRARASAAEAQHVFVLVEFAPRHVALARVSKASGEIVERIDLEGRSWQLDAVAQRVFRVDGSHKIVAFGS